MPHFRSTDLLRLNQALTVLHAEVEPATLFARLAQAAALAVAAETACFDGFDSGGRIGHLGSYPADTFHPATFPILQLCLPEHPLFGPIIEQRRLEPLRTSDYCRMPQFFRTTLFNEFYRPLALTHQLIVGMHVAGRGLVTCALNRRHRDFSDTERQLLQLLVPHFEAAIRHARVVSALRQPAPTTPTLHLGLTPREAVIVGQLAQGLSDKEIGQACGISVRTVQNHLQNVYTKLGVNGRTAALGRVLGLLN